MDPRAAEKGRDIMIGNDLAGASRLRRPAPQLSGFAVSRLRRPAEIQGPQRARPRSRAPESRGCEVEARRRVHDRALARHPDALHHQPALSDRGRLRRGAGRHDEDRVPRHRRSRASCCRSTRRTSAPAATTSIAILTDDQFRKIAARNIEALNGALDGLRRPTRSGCTSAGATTRARTISTCRFSRSSTSPSRRACRRSASRPPIRATITSGKTSRTIKVPDDKVLDSGRDRLDHELRRASEARGAAHRPLCRHRRPRSA